MVESARVVIGQKPRHEAAPVTSLGEVGLVPRNTAYQGVEDARGVVDGPALAGCLGKEAIG